MSTVVELLGVDFILKRRDRKRFYESQHNRQSPSYTDYLKTIDDLNEICEIINLSKDEYKEQRLRNPNRRNDAEEADRNKKILEKTQRLDYVCYTLDKIYSTQE